MDGAYGVHAPHIIISAHAVWESNYSGHRLDLILTPQSLVFCLLRERTESFFLYIV